MYTWLDEKMALIDSGEEEEDLELLGCVNLGHQTENIFRVVISNKTRLLGK